MGFRNPGRLLSAALTPVSLTLAACSDQAAPFPEELDTQAIEAEIWEKEAAIFEGRGRGDLSNYLDVTSSKYLGWPPVLDQPLSLDKFRAEANMGQSEALAGEEITFEKNGFTINDNTAITYFTSHRTRMGQGMAVNGSRDVDEYYENTHSWTLEDGEWRLMGGMARKMDGPRAAASDVDEAKAP